jgi:hypothetical protein
MPFGSARTVRATGAHTQVEVTRVWTGDATAGLDPVVTLQILLPELARASVQPAIACGH